MQENIRAGMSSDNPKGTDEMEMLVRFAPPEYPSGRLVPDYVNTMLDKVQPDSMLTALDRDEICAALKQWLVDVGLARYDKSNYRWEWTTPDWQKYMPAKLSSVLQLRFALHANIPLLEDHNHLASDSHAKRKVFYVQELIVEAILEDARNDEVIEKSWGRSSEDIQLGMVWGSVAVTGGAATTIAGLVPESSLLITLIGLAAASIAGGTSLKTFLTERNKHIGYKLTDLGNNVVEQFTQYAPVKAAGNAAQYVAGYSQPLPTRASTRKRQGVSRFFVRK